MSAASPVAEGRGGSENSGLRRLFSGKGGLPRIVVALVAICIAVAATLGSQRPPTYTLSGTGLTIKAASGETVPFADVTAVTLRSTMPPDLVKVVGDRVGSQLRGEFTSDGTAMRIYVNTSVPPFVDLTTRNGPVILNEQSAAATRSLYKEILPHVAHSSR